MRLIVLGAPGAGKGTQARNLAKEFKIEHISTGDILREHMQRKTPTGLAINDMMNKGQLVPDDLAISLVKERLQEKSCARGFILDGFPRTLIQAEAFDTISDDLGFSLDEVVSVEVKDSVIVDRMSGRMVCPKCGAMYHTLYYPSEKDEICAACDASLIQREDDKARTVENRLKLYHQITEPIIEYYRGKDILFEINGVGDIDTITKTIVDFLRKNKEHK